MFEANNSQKKEVSVGDALLLLIVWLVLVECYVNHKVPVVQVRRYAATR